MTSKRHVRTALRYAKGFALLVLGVIYILVLSWLADGIKGECLFEPWMGACDASVMSHWRRIGLVVLGFAVATTALYFLARSSMPTRVLAQSPSVRPHRVLIAPLSPFGADLAKKTDGKMFATLKDIKNPQNNIVLPFTGDLDKDIGAIGDTEKRWNGQQFLRALRPHALAGKLERLIMIGSAGTGGSYETRGKVEEWVKLYIGDKVRIESRDEATDFEDVESLQNLFDRIIRELVSEGIHESDILIDATGGQKTTSIAAALSTLHWKHIEFQYVESRDAKDNPRVISFNVVNEFRERGY